MKRSGNPRRFHSVVSAAAFLLLGALVLRAEPAAREGSWPVLKAYEGEYLRRVKMPVGGIGTGTISLSGRGALVDWEIRNNPAKGFTPAVQDAATAFYVRTETPDGERTGRLLEGPLDSELYEGGEGCRVASHGFPRFSAVTFKAAYPLAQVELADRAVPVRATLEAMNPLVPGDVEASGLPAVLLRWRIVNVSAKRLKVSLCGFLVNPAGGEPRRVRVEREGVVGVSVGSADCAATDDTLGRVALVVPSDVGAVTTSCRMPDCGWMVRMDHFWRRFCESGRVSDWTDPNALGELDAAAVATSFVLLPGEEKSVPFVLGWRFPHRCAWSRDYKDIRSGAFDPAREVGNWYATRFADEVAPAVRLLRGLEDLEAKTLAFVKGVLSSSAPAVVREAALFNLSTFRTQTCFRTADGHFFGWEGVFDAAGSCYGNCTHVWGYEHALVDLWPDLARDMLELQFGPQMDADTGHISFRVGLPLATEARGESVAAADGQMQCVVKAYEYWRKTGDDGWLRRMYPKVRQALAFCWVPGGWDADRDGVMEGSQHNTMDVNYYGPNPQMEFLYLAALRAGAAMAEAAGDRTTAADCRSLAARGSDWTEANLFNGAYYEHHVRPSRSPVAEGIGGACTNDPPYQLAAGCLVDQLVGDYAARQVGLGPVADEAHARTTLETILRRNGGGAAAGRYNCGRSYAFAEEPSLKMAWYPEGRMPASPFPYYGENMTGFEYVVAANLAQRGDFARAEKVVRDIRSRYDGRKRNPFDECECGHHYVRALASWSVLKAWRSAPCAKNGFQKEK